MFKILNKFFYLFLIVFTGILLACSDITAPGNEDPENNGPDPVVQMCSITFYANNGTEDFVTQEIAEDTPTALNANSFTCTDKIFVGWALSDSASEISYSDQGIITINTDISLYAIWIDPSESVKVTFYRNDSEEDTVSKSQYIKKNQDTNLIPNSFTKTDYFFMGWATDRTATSANYDDGASVNLTENLELYAVWGDSSEIGTVILHSNYGSDYTVTLYYPYSTMNIIPLADDIVVRTGYRILGWGYKPDSKADLLTSNYIQPAIPWIYNNNKETVHYYCIWQKEDEYSITFNPNYDDATEEPVQKKYERTDFSDKNIKVKIWEPDLFTRDGYKLVGWSNRSDFSNVRATSYGNGCEVSFERDTDMYAIWVEDSSTSLITYTYYKNDENAGTESEEKVVIPYEKSTPSGLAPVLFTRDRMALTGWATSRDDTWGRSPLYQTSASSDTSYYAVWQYTTPQITYKANFENSEFEDIVQNTEYNVTTDILECNWTRPGYGFAGWAKSADSTTVAYSSNSKITPKEDFTLYAVWKKNPVITFHPNYEDAEESEVTQTVLYNTEAVLDDVTFSRPGYFFLGFSSSETATDASFKGGNTVKFTTDRDLYAVWAIEKKVIYNSNYPSGTQKTEVKLYPANVENVPMEECPFEAPEGYFFYGWQTRSGQSSPSYPSYRFTLYDNSSDYDLYAYWAPIHTVKLYSNYTGKGSSEQIIEYKLKYREKLNFSDELLSQFTAPSGKDFWCFGQDNVKEVPGTNASNVYYERNTDFSWEGTQPLVFNLYAQWRAPLTVTFQANFEGAASQTITESVPYGINMRNITSKWDRSAEKYHFSGWGTTATTTSTLTSPIFNDMTVYAIWYEPVKYTYHNNCGETDETFVELSELGTIYNLPENIFTHPEGKTFNGWSYSATQTSGSRPGTEISAYYNKSNKTYYATWK